MFNLDQYINLYKKINSQANAIWNKVNFITIAEVINSEVDLDQIDKHIWALKDSLTKLGREIRKQFDQMEEDDYYENWEDADTTLSDLDNAVDNKLSAVDDIVSKLKDISYKSEEDEYLNMFKDIDQINITESLDYTKLKRFHK